MRRIDYLATGGTIASVPTGAGTGALPVLRAEDILASVPDLARYAHVVPHQFSQLPSASFGFADLLALHRECLRRVEDGAQGVVITQGTDSIEETSYFLDLLWDRPEPIVIAGAMRNPSLPGTDGPANLLAAVQTAAAPTARNCGVLVVMNDEIHAARFVRKAHTSSPAAFSSPVVGPIGWMAEGNVIIASPPPRRPALRVEGDRIAAVALLKIALGEDGRLFELLPGLGYEAVVIEGFGGGHVPDVVVEPFVRLMERLPVVLASRTGAGTTLHSTYQFDGGEIGLLADGAIGAGILDGLKSRLLLAVALSAGRSHAELPALFRLHGYGAAPAG